MAEQTQTTFQELFQAVVRDPVEGVEFIRRMEHMNGTSIAIPMMEQGQHVSFASFYGITIPSIDLTRF